MKRFLNQLSLRSKPKPKRRKRRSKSRSKRRISANSPEYQALFGSATSRKKGFTPLSMEPQELQPQEDPGELHDRFPQFDDPDIEEPHSQNNVTPASSEPDSSGSPASALSDNESETIAEGTGQLSQNIVSDARHVSSCEETSEETTWEDRLAKLSTPALQSLKRALRKAARQELRPKQQEILNMIVGELLQGDDVSKAPDFQSLLKAVEAEEDARRSDDSIEIDLAS